MSPNTPDGSGNPGAVPGAAGIVPGVIVGAGNGPAVPPANTGTPDPGKGQAVEFLDLGNGNKMTAEHAKAILTTKKGLEDKQTALSVELNTLKAKLEEIDSAGLNATQKLQKDLEKERTENARLLKLTVNTAINAEFTKHSVSFKPEDWAHSITDVSQVEGAVQTLIKDNPHLVAKGRPGLPGGNPPANQDGQGYAPPSGHGPGPSLPPPGTDQENELSKEYENATTPAELAALETKYHNLRGTQPAKGRQAL